MIYTLIIIPVIFVLLIVWYKHWAKILQKRSWEEAQMEELERANYQEEEPDAGSADFNWLFYGPGCTNTQEAYFNVVHYPRAFTRLFKHFFVTVPALSLYILFSCIRNMKWSFEPKITDKQIYDIFTFSPLLTVSELDEENDSLVLIVPEELPLETLAGITPGSLELVLSIREQKILKANWRGKNIIEDKGFLTSLIMHLITHWVHPQSHALAEKSAREIALRGLDALEPSHRYVNALHDGLLYSILSPISGSHPLSTGVTRDSLLASLKLDVAHNIDYEKVQFRYFNFLFKGREVLVNTLKKHELDINVEFLFHNMILHSVDHYCLHKYTTQISAWSMDGSKSLISYFRGKMFWSIWMPDNESWVAKERIHKLDPDKYPFYAELYQGLAVIDKEFADSVLCSTSF